MQAKHLYVQLTGWRNQSLQFPGKSLHTNYQFPAEESYWASLDFGVLPNDGCLKSKHFSKHSQYLSKYILKIILILILYSATNILYYNIL